MPAAVRLRGPLGQAPVVSTRTVASALRHVFALLGIAGSGVATRGPGSYVAHMPIAVGPYGDHLRGPSGNSADVSKAGDEQQTLRTQCDRRLAIFSGRPDPESPLEGDELNRFSA